MEKTKGSTMITILISMTFIIMVGVVSLSVILNDYKMRLNDSKNVANLYGAESGLDMAYNILVKVFDYAVEASNYAVETNFEATLDLAESQEAMNELFQKTFIEVFEPNLENYGVTMGMLEYSVENAFYPVFLKDRLDNQQYPLVFQPIDFTTDGDVDIEVIQTMDEDNLTFTVTFISKFITTSQSTEENERQVSVQYTLDVPTYQGVMQQNLVEVTLPDYPVFTDSVINIDGNARFKGIIDITGQIRVKGAEIENIDPIDGKYASGVTLKEATLTIDGDIITNETLSLNENATADITGNIFARNVYVGKTTYGTALATNVNLTVSDSLFLDNDLVVNVQSSLDGTITSSVTSTNLYGLNDKNTLEANGTPSRESSSLIVNSEGAAVTIKEETYLSGVAYINTNEPYQTGESVAIRGNYLAYSQILPGYEGIVQMKYYNPFVLVEAIEGDSSASTKANYFVEVATDGTLTLSSGGVSLNPNKVHTAGAWITQTQDQSQIVGNSSVFLDDDVAFLNAQRAEYARQVFNMGMPVEWTAYETGKVLKTINTVSGANSQINFDYIRQTPNLEFKNYYGEVIVNSDENLLIVVQENELGTNDIIYVDPNGEVKKVEDVTKAVIITAGDVFISGNVDLTGNIIAAGNLYADSGMETGEGIRLTFDSKVTNQIIALNYGILKEILNSNDTSLNQTVVKVVDGARLDEMETKYYAEDYILVGRWQLMK